MSLLVILVLGLAAGGAQQPSLPLGQIDVAGTKRFTVAEITKVSGLAPGASVSPPDFEAAAKRMAETGLFKRVAFRYAAPSGRWMLTFEIEDFDWNTPVIFDNFVWFADDELTRLVRESVPSFAGSVPATTEVTALLTNTLQRVLESRSLAGRVQFLPEGDLRNLKGYLFRVVNPAPQVCSWTFEGASGIPSSELEAELTTGGRDYSRTFVSRASRGTLLAVYRRAAYWSATVGEPVTSLSKTAGCDGVAVTVSLTEGPKYQWAAAVWTGNAAIPSRELDRLVGLKPGDSAGLRGLEDGLRRVATAYGSQGYVMARTTFAEKLDSAAKLATFAISVQEGPQFRMGALEFPGLAEADAAQLMKRWRLKAGDVFDASYPQKFFSEEISPRIGRGAKPPAIENRINAQQQVVDVRFVFAR